jgi:replicative superfamily II helicase
VIMEMAICRLYQQSQFAGKTIPKILYIAPIKQLVTEKRLEWERYHNVVHFKNILIHSVAASDALV